MTEEQKKVFIIFNQNKFISNGSYTQGCKRHRDGWDHPWGWDRIETEEIDIPNLSFFISIPSPFIPFTSKLGWGSSLSQPCYKDYLYFQDSHWFEKRYASQARFVKSLVQTRNG